MSEIERWQIDDAVRLKKLFNSKKKALGLSQEKIGLMIGSGQSACAHYLCDPGKRPKNALNIRVAIIFAREMGCDIAEFSPTLAQQIEEMTRYYLSSRYPDFESLIRIVDLMGKDQRGQLMAIARTFCPQE